MTTRILVGDCREVLAGMAEESVQVCLTSPPYWSLRDYNLPPSLWGGREDCRHVWGDELLVHQRGTVGSESTLEGGLQAGGDGRLQDARQGQFCQLCGCFRGCLGLEPSVDQYVANLVEVFRAVKRVLRDDGLLLLNLGDSYMSNRGNTPDKPGYDNKAAGNKGANFHYVGKKPVDGLKPKDLIGIPFRVAFALQADGWWLRSAIPWIKQNAMPESVRDRPTTAHEYWFLLSKQSRYHWDADAVRVQSGIDYGGAKGYAKRVGNRFYQDENSSPSGGGFRGVGGLNRKTCAENYKPGRNRRTSDTFNESLDALITDTAEWLAHLERVRDNGGMLMDADGEPLALMFSTRGFSQAHFATFSPDLILPLLKASTSERGACGKCGAAWVRVVEKVVTKVRPPEGGVQAAAARQGDVQLSGGNIGTNSMRDGFREGYNATTGWSPSCTCYRTRNPRKRRQQDIYQERYLAYCGIADDEDTFKFIRAYAIEYAEALRPYLWTTRVATSNAPTVPCVTLDPFAGAGTTSLVCERLGLDSVAIEMSPEYAQMAYDRIKGENPMFTNVTLESLQ